MVAGSSGGRPWVQGGVRGGRRRQVRGSAGGAEPPQESRWVWGPGPGYEPRALGPGPGPQDWLHRNSPPGLVLVPLVVAPSLVYDDDATW